MKKLILVLLILMFLLLISGCVKEIKTIEKGREEIIKKETKITKCDSWDFFRGKCGQEFSYCKKQGYYLKNLTQNEGWLKGGICVDENEREVGTISDLMNLSRYGPVDLSGVYCIELGYKIETRENEKGQYGVCIFS